VNEKKFKIYVAEITINRSKYGGCSGNKKVTVNNMEAVQAITM